TFLGAIAYLPSVALSIKVGLWSVAAADTIIYGWIVFLYFNQSISLKIRAVSISLIFYIIGIILLLIVGPFAGGPVWLFAFPVVVSILLGFQLSLFALAVNAVTLIMIGLLLQFGYMNWHLPTINPVEKWVIISLNFLVINSIVTIFIALITESMQSLMKRQKLITAVLRESEEKFQNLFEFAPDGFFIYDLEGNFIDGNKAAQDLIGYKKEELVGSSFLKLNLLPSEKLLKAAELLDKSYNGFTTGPDELLLNRKDGTQVVVEIQTLPITIKNQKIVIGIARDITERKQAEIEKIKLENQLRQAQKIETIGTLAGGIAHDFNNILFPIVGHTDMLLMDTPEDSPSRDGLNEIYTSA
ncbi:MAG: PAS domain S-box protein, partial [Victivallales bacterium]|nr:PAS domain S-box protein [Victivallales bacterium]